MTETKPPAASPDEVNRLWQHGLHEERLFHDRLNYFSFLETGLLTICVIMYNKEPALGLFLPITAVALAFTLLWLIIQRQHWAYCVHVNERIRQIVPEYKLTTGGFLAGGHRDGLSISKPLALAVPSLFLCTWVAFILWLVLRPAPLALPEGFVTLERVALVVLAAALGWLIVKVQRLERKLLSRSERSTVP